LRFYIKKLALASFILASAQFLIGQDFGLAIGITSARGLLRDGGFTSRVFQRSGTYLVVFFRGHHLGVEHIDFIALND
jgi:hypothetical protein